MRNLTKFAAAPLMALGAALLSATPASADPNDSYIIVTKMDQWQENATRKLDRALMRVSDNRNGVPAPGIVQLSFELGTDGRPVKVEVIGNSANHSAARSAAYAVRRMGDLSDVPVADAGNAQFLANVVFADDLREKRKLMAQLKRKERAGFAAKDKGKTYIVLSN